ncbi:MAG: hypothetical protein OXE92_00860 [Bacteroidetes bacterium]|nr:hypothetical protein [Bacteroidota bacterium]
MFQDHQLIRTLLANVRRQIFWRAFWQHLAICATICCVLFFTLLWLRPYLGQGLSGVALVITILIPILLLLLLQRRSVKVTDQDLALFIEEQHPDLEDRLNSAIQASDMTDQKVLDALVHDAAQHVVRVPHRAMLPRLRSRLWIVSSLAIGCAFLIVGLTQLDRLQLDTPLQTPIRTPYLAVSPGDIEVDQGETVSVVATLRSDANKDVFLVHQDADSQWVRRLMIPGKESGVYLAELADIQQNTQYYVESGRTRTDPYTISISLFPEVTQIDATYESPGYANLPVHTLEDEGDLEGLKGTRVTVTVHTNHVTEKAVLDLEAGADIPLSKVDPGRFRGSLDLLEEDRYTVQLQDEQERTNRFPRTYLITPVEDVGPEVTIHEPGRDLRANAVQEVLIAADATDEYGIRSFELKYSVNGEAEVGVDLLENIGATEATGEYLLFLEEYSLQPGDVITYHIEASDALQTAFSDLYFVEITPFEQQFTQLANAGGGQSGQGRQGGLVVSQQDIIAATWRLLREEEVIQDFDETLQALIQAQRNLQVNIQNRLRTTAFSLELRGSPEQQKIADHLQSAVKEMDQIINELSNQRLREALTPERRALNQLLRADALNTDRQVARQQQGGGGASATEERMSELMDLELDITKDKYESPQSAPAAQASAEENEALRRIRDLADRQQALAEQRPPERQEDQRRFVDRLKRSQEDLQQSLQDLRQQQSSGLTQNEMDETLRSMEEVQRALRRGDLDEAVRRQQQAANSLQSLEEALQIQTRGTDRRALEELSKDLQELIREEFTLNEDLAKEGDQPSREALTEFEERRSNSLERLENILEQAEMIESSNSEAQLTARNLRLEIFRRALQEDMENSQRALHGGWMPTARRIQEEITEDIEGLKSLQRELIESLPITEEERLSRSLEDLEQLRREAQDLEAQAQRLREGNGSPAQMARLENQMSQTREAARALQEGVVDSQGSADGIQASLSRADHTGVLLDEESAKAFFERDVYAPLSQLETQLREALATVKLDSKLYGSRRGEVPVEYQGLIEKYYELLSRRPSQ